MKIKYNLICLALISLIYTSCKKEKLSDKSVFVDSNLPKNALDNYVYNNYTVPYNIDIIYKYVDRESDITYNLVPATYDASVRMTKLLLQFGLKPYDEVTGSKTFIKRYFPKLLSYIGSSSVKSNGTIVLGTAEGGKKINLYNLNNLPTNSTSISYLNQYYFHVIHHEFQHILNQTKPFPTSFLTISGLAYVGDTWNTAFTSNAAAITAGFISPYASKEGTEDFAELYSFYVTTSATDYTAYLNSAGTSAAALAGIATITTKMEIVKTYMKNEFGIDMDVLRANIQAKVAGLPTFDQTTLP
ncbi:putative zinc-binding metallopeptidase [Pedobacter nototheniae]|uniref:zinc-binding metallopeptidase n=1 Tax=Pedobacter nototheniae TaxID=2488994 RepID=UPI00293073F7|nr:putative zinc-binding metallopeptidase [Pedobacter nototheniae]